MRKVPFQNGLYGKIKLLLKTDMGICKRWKNYGTVANNVHLEAILFSLSALLLYNPFLLSTSLSHSHGRPKTPLSQNIR